jgi:Tol biopolymer transport system component
MGSHEQGRKAARVGGAISAVALGAVVAAVAAAPAGAAFPGDNGRIVFQSNRDGHPEIYSMSPDGTNEVRLTNNPQGNRQPSYSPDGRKIVFVSHRNVNPRNPGEGVSEIYVMNPDGSDQTRLTNNTFIDSEPAFSADGRKILFTSNRTGFDALFSMNLDGTAQTQLTTNPNGRADNNPTPSPDGSRILFESTEGVSLDIFALDANGIRTNLTRTPFVGNQDPSFAPDGRTIAFDSRRGDLEVQVFLMDANGGNQENITSGTMFNREPAFSPDGRRVAFRGNIPDRTGPAIFTITRGGLNMTRLTTRGLGTADVLPDWGPRPSPTATADVLHGTTSRNVMCGRGGGDTVYGLGGNDTLFGDRCDAPQLAGIAAAAPPGGDRLLGGPGNDKLYAGGLGDRLHGGPGRDLLHGGAGPDRFEARDDRRDTIMCGSGGDVVRADAKDRLIDCER